MAVVRVASMPRPVCVVVSLLLLLVLLIVKKEKKRCSALFAMFPLTFLYIFLIQAYSCLRL